MKKNTAARLLALATAAMMLFGNVSALADDAAPEATAEAEATAAPEATAETEVTAAPEATAEAEATAEPRPEVDSSIVATIGDIKITAEETAGLFSYVLEMYGYYGYDVTDAEVRAQLEQITLDAMVGAKVQEIMEQERGLFEFTEEEIAQFTADAQLTYDETYASMYEGFDDGKKGEDEIKALVDEQLAEYDYTVEALVEQAKAEAAYERLYEQLTADVTVTDEEIKESYAQTVATDKATYDGDPAAYTLQCMYGNRPTYTPEGIRTVKHILIKYLDEDTQKINELMALSEKPEDYDAQYDALKQQAYANIKDKVDEVMAKIAEGGDFDSLVAEYGEDPGMKSEPYMSEGYMVFEGCTNLVEEFVDSAMALEKIGDVTAEPALTSYGAHIMLYFSDLASGEAELTEDQAEQLRAEMLTQKKSDTFNAAIDARTAELGAVYKYPENLVESKRGDAEAAADENAGSETLVVDGEDEGEDEAE
ncbi:MAG: peptidylprolyl isomerase [Candidatus Fimadaptatus sp.]|jgi:hypothetical protein